MGEHLLLRRGAGRRRRAGRRSSSVRSTPSNSVTVDKSPAVALAHGVLGPPLRPELVEHPRAAGARRRRRGRRALPGGATLVLRRLRAPRGRGARDHAGRRAHVPLQQPRRRCSCCCSSSARLRDGPRARGRQHVVVGARVFDRRLRFPRQDAAGAPRAPRVRARVPDRRAGLDHGSASGSSTLGVRRVARVGGMVDRASSSSGRRRHVRTSAGRRHNSVLELIFGYNGFGRLTGNETGSVGGGGGQAGRWGADGTHAACSAPSSAPRSRGCSPPR